MISLVIGGSGSGKSEYAEAMVLSLPSENKVYLATMNPTDDTESRKKIERHKTMRRGKGFETIECNKGIDKVQLPPRSTVLVECLSNLIANEMFMDFAIREYSKQEVISGIQHIILKAENVVFVSNNIFEDGMKYDEMTKEYMKNLSEINKYIATFADSVIEVVHGIPIASDTYSKRYKLS